MPKTIAAQGFFEIMGRIKSVSKVVQKQAFSCNKTWTKHGQKTLLFSDNNRVKTVSKTSIMVQAKGHQNASSFGG